MDTFIFFKRAFVILFFSATLVNAQNILTGTVTDASTGDPLIGANVVVTGTSLGAATDLYGKFRIVGIPNGEYVIKVSYIGYEAKTITVRFSGKEEKVNLQLAPEAIEGQVVEVFGQLRGQMAAINQQISAQSIVNVVSEEKIKELPDANAAEAIGRLPGVSLIRSGGEATKIVLRGLSSKFSNITIDGVKIPSTEATNRGVDLSMISQGALSGIELFKALTSEQDGDAIAGTVNLVTKKAPEIREIRIEAKGNYNHLMNSARQYDVSGKYGERFFNDFLGVQLTANTERKIRSNERYDLDYTQDQPDTLGIYRNYYINNFNLQFIDEVRKRNGAGILLDFNTPDGGYVKLNNMFSKTERNYTIYQRNYPFSTDIRYGARVIDENLRTINSSLQGNNTLYDIGMNWGLSFAQSDNERPFDFYIDFLEPNSPTSGLKPGMPQIKENPEHLMNYAWNNFSAAACSVAYSRYLRVKEIERSAFLTLNKAYSLSALFSGEVKIGAKYKEKGRSKSSNELQAPYWLGYWRPTVLTAQGTVIPKALYDTRFDRFYRDYLTTGNKMALAADFLDKPQEKSRDLFDKYTLTPLLNSTAVREWYYLNIDGYDASGGSLASEYYANPLVAIEDYGIKERVTAAFISNSLNIGQFATLYTGLRVEQERNTYNSKFSPEDISGFPITAANIVDTSATHVETIYLPNIQLVLRPTDFMNVRLAAYRALARPDFNMRLVQYVAYKSTATPTLTIGNPNLRTAKAWNYELNTSFFGDKVGLVSISGFYKEIKDMYLTLNGLTTVGDSLIRTLGIEVKRPTQVITGVHALTTSYNSPKPTKVWGIEFEHQADLTFLPGMLRNIVLNYNFTICRSETYAYSSRVGSRLDSVLVRGRWQYINIPINIIEQRKLSSEGQPNVFGNVSLGYDLENLSFRVSAFYQGQYNNSISVTGFSDQVVEEFIRVDFAAKYQLTHAIALIMNINNLNNVSDKTAIENRKTGWHLPDSRELYGMTMDVGVRVSL